MPLRKILVDTGFLFIIFNITHKDHAAARKLVQTQVAEFVIPYVVLTETAFLFGQGGNIYRVARFMNDLAESNFDFEPITRDDLKRASGIMAQYASAEFDFVDCCLMAISERLNITEVCTLDHRDFSIFRPRHCDYLTLLP